MRFKDSVVVVTGAGRGIGLEIVEGFASEGASCVLVDIDEKTASSAAAKLKDVKTAAYGADVTDLSRMEEIASEVVRDFEKVDVLVNNAGTNPYYGNISDSEEWAWDKTMDVNLKAPYILSVALGKKMMAAGGGSIINIASVAGIQASKNQGIYSVTKSALIMLTKVLAREMGQGGVRANAILPGLIKTELSRAMWDDEAILESVVKETSLGRIGTVDELAGAAIFLASDAGSYTSGAVIQVDGGMVI